MEACVKVGDTIPDILEGLNAGMWTIAVAASGNELGLSEYEVTHLAPDVLRAKLIPIYQLLYEAGAHFVVDTIADVPPILDKIEALLKERERPPQPHATPRRRIRLAQRNSVKLRRTRWLRK